jgi:hypothetical protein
MQLLHTSFLTLTILSTVLGFVPQKQYSHTGLMASPKNVGEILGDAKVDLKHAHYCADHFGECSLEDMENLCDGE